MAAAFKMRRFARPEAAVPEREKDSEHDWTSPRRRCRPAALRADAVCPPRLILVFFYLLIMRPQQKKFKEHQNLLSELKPGDKVLLSSGIAGKITKTGEKFFTVEIARNVEIQVERNAVAARNAE